MARFIKSLSDLQPGDHVCWLYDRDKDHQAVISQFVRLGLERGEKVLYVADTHSCDTILEYLRNEGLDADAFVARGQLAVTTAKAVYLEGGYFDPEAMLALLQAETQRALDEGYTALRATGETQWVCDGARGADDFLEYETRLHDFFSKSRCMALCQYDQRRADPSLLLDVLQVHAWILVGQLVFRNLYFQPVSEWPPSRSRETVRRWMTVLVEIAFASETVRRSEENYRRLFETMAQGIVYQASEGRIVSANPAAEQILGLSIDEMYGRTLTDPCWEVIREDGSMFPAHEHPAMVALRTGNRVEHVVMGLFNPKRCSRVWVSVNAIPLFREEKVTPCQVYTTLTDITETKLAERERELMVKVLNLINESADLRLLARGLVELLREEIGCDAVGIRLRDGDDFPYFESRGFSPEFVLAENHLCALDACGTPRRGRQGNPVLECLCGNVLCGRFDAAKPFYTASGSFWTNSTTELLNQATDDERQARTRNRCNREGYESVALIPLRAGGKILGLLQLNDRRKGLFTLRGIEFLEQIAGSVALALAHCRSQDLLRENELRFRQLAENLPEMVWVVTADWKSVEYVSQVYERLTGRSCKSLLTMPSSWLQAIHPEDRQRVRDTVLAYNPQSGKPIVLPEARVVHLDGSVRWMITRGVPIPDQDGRVHRVAGISEDITDRKRAEAAMRRRIAFERLVAEMGSDLAGATAGEIDPAIQRALAAIGAFIHADRAVIVEFQRGGRHASITHEWRAEGVPAKKNSFGELSFDEELPWVAGLIRNHQAAYVADVAALPPEAASDRRRLEIEGIRALIAVPILSADRLIDVLRFEFLGEQHEWGEEDKSLLQIAAQAIGGVRERAEAERLLKRERDLAQNYLDTVEAIIVALDREGKVTMINRKGCALLGYREEELIGRDWFETCLPQPEGLERVRPVFLALISGGIGPNEYFTNPVITRDGQLREIAWHNALLKDQLGRIIGTLSAGEDITDRLRIEAELRESTKRRNEMEKLAATGRMAAVMAHEINNPLAGIKNAFRLIREAVPAEHPDIDMVDRVGREIDRIADIVRRMYQVYTPRTAQPADVPLGACVRDVTAMLAALCRECHAKISVNHIPTGWTIHAHAGDLYQVLYNLIANAVQASPVGGVVRVEAECEGNRWIVIHVRDQGPGIPVEVQDHLFEPFVTAPVGNKHRQGLGLGLAVVRSIVASLGGRIEVDTAPDQGTCFRVYLPREGTRVPVAKLGARR